jgi:uncharacterized metal-binding protein YceD (DUF177 family)
MQGDSATYKFLLDTLFFAKIDSPEVQKGKINVELVVKRVAYIFELNFRREGFVRVPCDRCLDDMEQPIDVPGKLMVKMGREYAQEDDLIVVPEEEGEINVAWFMYEFIALAIPMKHIHAPGKCNKIVTDKLRKHLKTDDSQEDNEETNMPDEMEDMGDIETEMEE